MSLRILHLVEHYLPLRSGMSEVVRQLSERMVEDGHRVTVGTSENRARVHDTINGVRIKSFDVSGNWVSGLGGEVKEFLNFVESGHFDIITLFAAQQWTTDALLPNLGSIQAKKVFVPTGFSGLNHLSYEAYYQEMTSWLKGFDALIFLSEYYQDYDFALGKGLGTAKMHVIPNGADEREFLTDYKRDIREELGLHPDRKIILHVGSFTTLKGHEEALEIFLHSREQNSELIFVGGNFMEPESRIFRFRAYPWQGVLRTKNPFRVLKYLGQSGRIILLRKTKKIRLMKLERQQLVALYQAADIFLFPTRIECSPVVLFEAMASKTPFLSSDAGNAREIVAKSSGGAILPTSKDTEGLSHVNIKQSALLLDNLLRTPAQRQIMVEKGFAYWKQNHRWAAITRRYLDLYEKIST